MSIWTFEIKCMYLLFSVAQHRHNLIELIPTSCEEGNWQRTTCIAAGQGRYHRDDLWCVVPAHPVAPSAVGLITSNESSPLTLLADWPKARVATAAAD